jgi:hypothetical protein
MRSRGFIDFTLLGFMPGNESKTDANAVSRRREPPIAPCVGFDVTGP